MAGHAIAAAIAEDSACATVEIISRAVGRGAAIDIAEPAAIKRRRAASRRLGDLGALPERLGRRGDDSATREHHDRDEDERDLHVDKTRLDAKRSLRRSRREPAVFEIRTLAWIEESS